MTTCHDMQTLVETAEQDQERRDNARKQRFTRDGFTRMQAAKPAQVPAAPVPTRQRQDSVSSMAQPAEAFAAQQQYQRKYLRPARHQRISPPEGAERVPTGAEEDPGERWFCKICRTYEHHMQQSCQYHDYCYICQKEGHIDRFHNEHMNRAEEQE